MALLLHVALGGGDRLCEVFAHKINCEAGPSCKVAGIDGVGPSGRNWAEASAMQVSHDVLFDSELVNVVGRRLVVELLDKWRSGRQGAWL